MLHNGNTEVTNSKLGVLVVNFELLNQVIQITLLVILILQKRS